MTYEDALTVREAQARYFADGNLGTDGGYGDRWVKLKLGFVRIYLPNISARVEVLPYHDAHHVLTGYDASWTGEAEVAAWEIASGCGRYWEAWLVNLHAVAIGLFVDARATFRAFVRGRRSPNLFGRSFDALRDVTLGDLRRELRLGPSGAPRSRASDRVAFAFWAVAALGAATCTLAALGGVVVAVLLLARRLLG